MEATIQLPNNIEIFNQTLSQIAAGLKPARAEYLKGKNDLYYLCTDILGYNQLGTKLHRDEYIPFLLDEKYKYFLGLLPRGHLKTTVGTIGLAIYSILRDPNIRILITNCVWDNARTMLAEIKGHFQKNERFRLIYGDLVGDKWNEDDINVRNRTRDPKEPTISTSGLERTKTSQHYDLIIADDLVARENINTYEQLQKVILYFKDLQDLLEPNGKLYIHGTRWHHQDLYGWILKNLSKSFKIMVRRAIENKKPILPERFTIEHLKHLKQTKETYEFMCQYFNHPTDLENALIKKSYIRYYTMAQYEKYLLTYPISITATLDPSDADAPSGKDSSAITVVGTTVNDEWLVLEVLHGRWNTDEIIDKVLETQVKWGVRDFGIEEHTFNTLLKQDLVKKAKEKKIYFTPRPLSKNPRVTKAMRIRSLEPRFKAGKCFILQNQTELEYQLLQWPNVTLDDIIDSLARHMELAEIPMIPKKKIGNRDLEQKLEMLPWNIR